MSNPEIKNHKLERQGEWKRDEGIFNSFSSDLEGKIVKEQKKIIEKRLFDDLKNENVKNNELLIKDLLKKYGIEENLVSIEYI